MKTNQNRILEQGGFKIDETVLYEGKEVEIDSFPDKISVELNLNLTYREKIIYGLDNYKIVSMHNIKKLKQL